RGRVLRAERGDAGMPSARSAGGSGVEAVGLLGVARTDLLLACAVELGLAADVAAGPHIHALWAHMDVDAGEVPVEESNDRSRRLALGDCRQLLGRLFRVSLAVGVQ